MRLPPRKANGQFRKVKKNPGKAARAARAARLAAHAGYQQAKGRDTRHAKRFEPGWYAKYRRSQRATKRALKKRPVAWNENF